MEERFSHGNSAPPRGGEACSARARGSRYRHARSPVGPPFGGQATLLHRFADGRGVNVIDFDDLVVEFGDGRVLAFEVKAGERVSGKEFTGLRKLRNSLGVRFVAGVAVSLGSRSYTYAEGLHVMPADRLCREVRR